MFLNKNTHEQVAIFNDILFSNYIHNKYVTIDDRDPSWMTEKIINKINLKRSLFKSNKFSEIQMSSTEISALILERKEKYYHDLSIKLNDPKTSAKTYWSVHKSFHNDSKIPLIPPLLVNNKIVSDFAEKANPFNDFFATQCTPLSNNSVLPSAISFKTLSRLSSINFKKEDILKVIRNLNVNKAHGHDSSIRMLKICDSVLVEPLPFRYKNCINSEVFPDIWKRSYIILTNKEKDKRCINNYRPVSYLSVCGKICILYNSLFLYLESNNLLSPHQLGFRPNDSCTYQLLSIAHSIYTDFDHIPSLEVRGIFLDIPKAFDKV